MQRNLDRRVEVTCPIYDPELQQELRTFLDLQFKDNTKARILDSELKNSFAASEEKRRYRTQWDTYTYLKKLSHSREESEEGTADHGQTQGKEPVQTGG
jgi:polyphosphate kinase